MDDEGLRGCALFGGLSDDEAAAMQSSMATITLRRGQALFREGEPGRSLFLTASGKMRITRLTPRGRDSLIAVLGPGQVLGELSLFDTGVRTATASAVTESVVLELTGERLQEWSARSPAIAQGMLLQLSRRLRRANDVVTDLVFAEVPTRVAKCLLELAEQFGAAGPGGLTVRHDLTQEELAQLVGAARETVNKALAEFASRGWIELGYRTVVITRPEALGDFARATAGAHGTGLRSA